MTRLDRTALKLPGQRSVILSGAEALIAAGGELEEWLAGRTVFLVASAELRELHGDKLEALAAAAAHWVELEVPDGEAAKSAAVVESLWQRMSANGGKRDSRLLTLGGGSTGDLGGFAAATFLRGIEYAQLPTSLLAMVDASIGGKTGIDLPAAKNSVGAFHQPRFVVADARMLETLPLGELRSGLVEMIKMAATLDADLFARLEADIERLAAGDLERLAPLIGPAAAAKVAVVNADPFESGYRRVLNFGHTLGHALEAASRFRLRHGEAVAYGILFALALAVEHGLEAAQAARVRNLLAPLELPRLPAFEVEDLVEVMRRDKKATEAGLAWVLPVAIGRAQIVDDVGWEEVTRRLPGFLADPWS